MFDLTYGVLGVVAITFILNAKNIKTGLKISVVENGVKAKGTIYFINANNLVATLEKASENQDEIVLDLAEVERVDQTALEKIAVLRKKLKVQNKTLSLINANEKTKARIDKFIGVL